MENKPSDSRDKGTNSEAVLIELTEQEDGAGDIAAEDANHVDSKPRNQEVRYRVPDSGDTKGVAEEKDQEAK